VLVVDDESVQLESICRGLFLYGYESAGAKNAAEAVRLCRSGSFDIVVTDLTMPGGSGCELISALREANSRLPVVVITGLALRPEVVQATRVSSIRVLHKPFSPDELDAAIRALFGAPPRSA
jgi:DNA-binding response OmpR family regulator